MDSAASQGEAKPKSAEAKPTSAEKLPVPKWTLHQLITAITFRKEPLVRNFKNFSSVIMFTQDLDI